MADRWQIERDLARKAARAAGELLLRATPKLEEARTKSNAHDLVTEWDLACETAIREVLEPSKIAVLGEEQGLGEDSVIDASSLRWLVDPIDGTVNFAHGLPHFCVSIALESAGVPVVGVVLAPMLNWEFEGYQGGGARFNGAKMSVSQTKSLSQAMLATGFPYDKAETRHNFREWDHMQVKASACRRFGAAALDLAMVARGWLDGYWESRLSPWDVSAGALLVEEAGGTITNLTGGPFCSDDGEAVASNGSLHELFLTELKGFQTK